jgi:hypothetical protein
MPVSSKKKRITPASNASPFYGYTKNRDGINDMLSYLK